MPRLGGEGNGTRWPNCAPEKHSKIVTTSCGCSETKAAKAKTKADGVVPAADDDDTLQEIHLIRFPDERAFTDYQADPDRRALEAVRRAVVLETEIFVGEDGPHYGR